MPFSAGKGVPWVKEDVPTYQLSKMKVIPIFSLKLMNNFIIHLYAGKNHNTLRTYSWLCFLGRRGLSRTAALDLWRADFGLFREGPLGCSPEGQRSPGRNYSRYRNSHPMCWKMSWQGRSLAWLNTENRLEFRRKGEFKTFGRRGKQCRRTTRMS